LELADTHLYKQLGNSVTVNVIEAIAQAIKQVLKDNEDTKYKSNCDTEVRTMFENGNYNSGEWAELYTFLELLHNNTIYRHNNDFKADLNRVLHADYIIKNEDLYKNIQYDLSKSNETIEFNYLDNIRKVERKQIYFSYYWLYNKLISKATKFDAPDSFCSDMDKLFISKVKAPSSCYADLVLGFTNNYGDAYKEFCSVKSSLRNPSTPFNAGKATRFIYEVENCSDDKMILINKMYVKDKKGNIKYNEKNIPSKDIVRRITNLTDNNNGKISGIRYFGVANSVFKENLDNTSARLDEILAYTILYSILYKKMSEIKKIVELLENINPLDINVKDYKKKLGQFVKNASLGMTAGTRYEEEIEEAGLLIVNKEGKIILINKNEKAEYYRYLYENIKIDRPSSKDDRPTAYGDVYSGEYGENGEDSNKKYITLNFQLRLK